MLRKFLRIIWLLLLRIALLLIWGSLRITELLLGKINHWLLGVIKTHTKL